MFTLRAWSGAEPPELGSVHFTVKGQPHPASPNAKSRIQDISPGRILVKTLFEDLFYMVVDPGQNDNTS